MDEFWEKLIADFLTYWGLYLTKIKYVKKMLAITFSQNKLTKLGRCDRYTIAGLLIGLLGLLGLLGVQDC